MGQVLWGIVCPSAGGFDVGIQYKAPADSSAESPMPGLVSAPSAFGNSMIRVIFGKTTAGPDCKFPSWIFRHSFDRCKIMAKAAAKDGSNMSQAIRDIYKENPKLKAKEIQSALAERGIDVKLNLVYLVVGKEKGANKQRRKVQRLATNVATAAGNHDAVQTILKVKALATEVGGYDTLKELIEALSS
jgi:hypothetical protein